MIPVPQAFIVLGIEVVFEITSTILVADSCVLKLTEELHVALLVFVDQDQVLYVKLEVLGQIYRLSMQVRINQSRAPYPRI